MRFEWDEKKRRSNVQRHGIDFAEAEKVFTGQVLTVLDDRYDYDEARLFTLGLLDERVVAIAHTETAEVTRIFPSERHRGMKKRSTTKKSETDWKRIDAMKDEDIDFSDIPEATPEMFARAVLRRNFEPIPRKKQLTLRVDSDVVEWYRKQGRGYQTKINALLRAYMKEHQRNSA
jgi:uncharacterized protein (DUF4415 family)